jgi:HemY protein
MIRVLVYLAIIAALALGAVWLAERPGEVSVLWQGYRIETSVAVAAIGVAALAFAAMVVWSLGRYLFGLPAAFGLSSRARRERKGMAALSRGMVAVGAGDEVAAARYANEARKHVPGEPLTMLLDAQTAQMRGDRAAAEAQFRAMLDRSETRVLGLRGLFVEARRRGDAEAARTFADEAVKLSPSIPWANDALLEFHTAIGDWQAARTAVERRTALKLADKAQAKRHRAVLLTAEALQRREEAPETALSIALEAVKLAPGLIPAAALAGQMLIARGDLRKASKIAEAAWRENTHPDLARIYVAARKGDRPEDALARAETLAKLRPGDAESALIVAETAIAAKAFDKARAALTPLLAGAPTMRACLLMAELEDAEKGASGRAREWLQRATRAHRDPAWVADGVVSAHWLPASPVTGALDAFQWTLPPAALGSDGPILDEEQPDPIEAEAPTKLIEGEVIAPASMPPASMQPEASPSTTGTASSAGAAQAATSAGSLPPAAERVEPVVFPIARAPDDPGAEGAPAAPAPRRRFRLFG